MWPILTNTVQWVNTNQNKNNIHYDYFLYIIKYFNKRRAALTYNLNC